MNTGRTALYRVYDNADFLLYIGVTGNPTQRFTKHRYTKMWWDGAADRVEIQWFSTRAEALVAEKWAIYLEEPLKNIARPRVVA